MFAGPPQVPPVLNSVVALQRLMASTLLSLVHVQLSPAATPWAVPPVAVLGTKCNAIACVPDLSGTQVGAYHMHHPVGFPTTSRTASELLTPHAVLPS